MPLLAAARPGLRPCGESETGGKGPRAPRTAWVGNAVPGAGGASPQHRPPDSSPWGRQVCGETGAAWGLLGADPGKSRPPHDVLHRPHGLAASRATHRVTKDPSVGCPGAKFQQVPPQPRSSLQPSTLLSSGLSGVSQTWRCFCPGSHPGTLTAPPDHGAGLGVRLRTQQAGQHTGPSLRQGTPWAQAGSGHRPGGGRSHRKQEARLKGGEGALPQPSPPGRTLPAAEQGASLHRLSRKSPKDPATPPVRVCPGASETGLRGTRVRECPEQHDSRQPEVETTQIPIGGRTDDQTVLSPRAGL